MKRLILVRHAKAESRAGSGRDFDRALSPQGREAAAALGERLAAAGLLPHRARVSAALRTRQTFELMQPHLPDAHLEDRTDLYEASADQLEAAGVGEEGEDIMLVGHNPGIGALAQRLAQRCLLIGVEDRQALEAGFPTGSAVAFEFDGERTGCLGVFRGDGAP